jgi:hypothetical protein
MNYIKHLAGFFEKISQDDRLNPTHVSLYVSLFQFWNASRFHNPISISRTEAMKVSKICSKATYHKCIRDLNDFGYLSYQPSYNPFKGSLVYLFNFQSGVNNNEHLTKSETSTELALNSSRTKNRTSSEQALNKQRTSTEQALVSYINNTNIINNTNSINKREAKKTNSKKTLSRKKETDDEKFQEKPKNSELSKIENPKGTKKEKLRQKKKVEGLPEIPSCHPELVEAAASGKKVEASGRNPERQPREKNENLDPRAESRGRAESRFQRPLLLTVQTYFQQNNWPALEAEKFYNHYQSNGWLVAGKTPMADWQASAEKWMLNANQFNAKKLPSPLEDLSRTSFGKGGGMRLQTKQNKNYNEPL